MTRPKVMRSVGVQDLRLHAGELVAAVARGEIIEILDRGQPVAVLAPVPGVGALQQLRASGHVSVSSGSVDDLPEPLILPKGAQPPSMALARLRADERA
jgi:prevent-host-death family protein